MASKIEPRPGLIVFANKGGTLSISQDDPMGDDDHVVIVHPDDIEKLCEMLLFERDSLPRSEEE
jgi:hypothetical protein